jgi:CRP-like cAMP-binding protein
MTVHSKLWYLQRFGLLDALGEPARQRLAQSTRMLEVKRGRRVYLPGDPSDQIFLLKTGVIKIAAIGPHDREAILAFLYPGDIFGELALVDNSPRDHLAEAHEDSLLCAINKDVMLRLIRESPELGYRITKLMGLRLKALHTRLGQLLYKSASARIAETLVELGTEHGVRDDRGTIVPFRLSQRELANLVGLTRETVNLVLHELRQEGLVEVDRGRVRLLDVQKLRDVR